MKKFFGISGMVISLICLLFIIPFISFWLSYFGGWICKIVIGKYLIEGLSFLHIIIPINKIPLLAGTLGWFGAFFKTHYNINNKHNNTSN